MAYSEVVSTADRYAELLINYPNMLVFKHGLHDRSYVQHRLLDYTDGPVMFVGYDDSNSVDNVRHRGMDWYFVIYDRLAHSKM